MLHAACRAALALLILSAATLPAADKPPADVPVPRVDKDGKPLQAFYDNHEKFLARGKEGPIGLLFIGDSITAGWRAASDIWNTSFGSYQPANFGIGGDTTQSVLWRITNGELEGISPAVVVLLIGVNNGKDVRVADGITAIVGEIRKRLPKSRVLLLGIFPYGSTLDAKPWTRPMREHVKQVNARLAKLDDGKHVRFLDFGNKFLQADGSISKDVMPDGLHPAKPGYQIWADQMKPLLDQMMRAPR